MNSIFPFLDEFQTQSKENSLGPVLGWSSRSRIGFLSSIFSFLDLTKYKKEHPLLRDTL